MNWWMWLTLLIAAYGAFVVALVASGVMLGLWVRRARSGDPSIEAHHRTAFLLEEGIGTFRRLRGLCFEVCCQAIVFAMQGLHLVRVLPKPGGDPSRTPVLVLPGYTEDSGAMWWTARGLARRGCNPILVDFPSTFAPIEKNAEFLTRKIAEVRAQNEGRPVLVVAHSMGGLVARAVMHDHADHGIAALVAIATPFRGTTTAQLGAMFRLGASVRQMCPGSELLLRYPPELGCPVPIMCAVALQDHIVMPEWTAHVAGAELTVVPEAYGHTAPLFVAAVLDRAAEFLLSHDPKLRATNDAVAA